MKPTSEFSKSKYNLKDENGLYKLVRGYKKYFKEEIPIDDVWDIPLENVQSKEIQNYPTQKPVKLLEQILLTASQK
jgi:DNA modification methylase